MGSIKQGDVSNGLHQVAVERGDNARDHFDSRLAIRCVEAHLDQFVMVQRVVSFGKYRIGQTCLSNHNDRPQ